jgi:hypothetical protein
MEMWQWRKEMNKLNEVERYFYNVMCRKSKHINCPNIVLKQATRHKKYYMNSGYMPYGLYCKNHSVFLQWVPDDLLTRSGSWSKLGIERIYF